MSFSQEVLNLDYDQEIEKITSRMREILRNDLHRRGLVVAISGGIDSSVCSALSVKAVGPKKVHGLLMPERDSSSTSSDRGEILAKHLGIEYTFQNIAPTLDAIGCYQWRDDAILEVFPDYGEGWKNKIIIKGGIEGKFNHFALVVEDPNGKQMEKNLPLKQYLQIVAATNHKQRIRKALDYFHADRLHYAVVGTPNRVEFDQGFFVKNGDGSADLKPIAHLYKSQVYALARHMELPEEICSAIPTTDTYSLPQGQDEFYFALPYQQMDLALWAFNHDVSAEECAEVLGLEKKVVEYVYKDIVAKRNTTAYMHRKAVLIEPVSEITV